MPEFPERSVRNIAREAPRYSNLESEEELKKQVEALNLKYRGFGAECVVVSVPGENERVFAINFGKVHPIYARKIYYTQRILSTLFPHNFPRFHMASGTPENADGTSGTVRTAVEGQEGNLDGPYHPGYDWGHPKDKLQAMIAIVTGTHPRIEHSFGAARRDLKRIGLNIHFDPSPWNFIVSKDGEEFYVDTPHPIGVATNDAYRIMTYMKAGGYTAEQRRAVAVSLERLKALNDEAIHTSDYYEGGTS